MITVKPTKDTKAIASVMNSCKEWNEELWVDDKFFENFKQGWLAFDGKKPVGCAMINEAKGDYELTGLAVLNNYRGTKISKNIIDTVFDYCKREGLKKVYLTSRLHDYFRKLGFREIPLTKIPTVYLFCFKCEKRGKTCNPKAFVKAF